MAKPMMMCCRVARYQQLQQRWSKDSFLLHNTTGGRPRRNLGFQAAFAAAHEATEADLEALKQQNAAAAVQPRPSSAAARPHLDSSYLF